MIMNKRFYTKKIDCHGDNRGSMCVLEGNAQIPFDIARIFYDYKNAEGGEPRGNHANRNSQFAFVCVAGRCEIEINDGNFTELVVLDDPTVLLVMEAMVWKEIKNFSANSVLLVLSDHKYDKNEYIYDLAEFMREVHNSDAKNH